MNQYPKRLIEVDFPIKRISARTRGERNILSSLHQWWARRPLGACRAVTCGSLWPDPADPACSEIFADRAEEIIRRFAGLVAANREIAEMCSPETWNEFRRLRENGNSIDRGQLRQLLLSFISDFSGSEAASNSVFVQTAQGLTEAAHASLGGSADSRPLVFDPFAGGGSIPLEALRCGADVVASDLNPIPVLLNKMALEWAPRDGDWLADTIRVCSNEAQSRTREVCEKFYAPDAVAYLWARTIACEGPSCGVRVPVLRSLWIDKSRKNTYAYALERSNTDAVLKVRILDNPRSTDVKEGTSRRGSVTCPACGFTTGRRSVESQAKNQGLGQQLMAVVTARPSGRHYRLPEEHDFVALRDAEQFCRDRSVNFPSFDVELPYLRSIFNVHLYGMTKWRHLFSDRQFAYLRELSEQLVRTVDEAPGVNDVRRVALRTGLAFVLDRVVVNSCNVTRWRSDNARMEGALSMMALPMVWDWVELNPFNGQMSSFQNMSDAVAESIIKIAGVSVRTGIADQSDATTLPLADDSASLFFTDPPYYDYVPYANLSDFYYVWLKRQVGDLFPFLANVESPKSTEIVQLAERNIIYAHKTKEFFERQIGKAFSEARRVTAPASVGVVVFAHKSTAVWETLLGAIVDAGWVITASWPLDTELSTRFKAIGTASLNSSIHLVCRPRENPDGSERREIGDWRDVLRELPVRINGWMPRLAEEGVVGADAIFACLGPALEIFSRFSSVEKPSGEEVKLREYLEYVWAAVAKEALDMIFEGADATGFEEDARLTAMWLWTLFAGAPTAETLDTDEEPEDSDDEGTSGKATKSAGYILEYDAARKIAQGLGAHLEDLASIVEVKGDKARLLPVSERARDLFGYLDSSATEKKRKTKTQKKLFEEMEEFDYEATTGIGGAPEAGATTLDRIHQTMLLFAAGRSEAIRRFLVDDGVGNDERFWRLANALSALYPSGTDEKRWVDGVLARKKGLGF